MIAPALRRLTLAALLTATAFAQTEPASFSRQALTDKLTARYPDGIVATVNGSDPILVKDVVRDVAPLLAKLRTSARNEEEFQAKLDALCTSSASHLTARATAVQRFRAEGRSIPDDVIDDVVAKTLEERFQGDRARFLEHLRAEEQTLREYRRDVEANIIANYQRRQRTNDATAAVSAAPTEPEVRLRLIQLTRSVGEDDAALQARAARVRTRLDSGETFDALARELSQDSRREQGGDWGWVKQSELRPEFATLAFGLQTGSVSTPVVTPKAAFLLYVSGRR